MITYREAIKSDWKSIALLHALSWQLNYRGSMSDEYLDNKVVDERIEVWEKRFEKRNDNQLIILAEEDKQLIGLSCIYLNADETYGALLDNLHVHPDHMRKGIGKELMKRSAELVLRNGQNSSMYLWVITSNDNAISFYESVGGQRGENYTWKTPDNLMTDTYRYVWNDLKKLSTLTT